MRSHGAMENGPLGVVLSQLENVKQHGDRYQARCPVHEDRQASLSVTEGSDGRVLLKCFAGCKFRDIVRGLHLKPADLFPPANGNGRSYGENGHGPNSHGSNGHHGSNGNGRPASNGRGGGAGEGKAPKPAAPKRQIVATYDYRDADGELVFQVVRYEPKGFSQRRPDGNGAWIWGLGEGWYVRRELGGDWFKARGGLDSTEPPEKGARQFPACEPILYRLPELAAAIESGRRIYLPEGEKDAESLRALGLCATTCPMGAGKWRSSYSKALQGAHLVFLPDNDNPGRQHAEAAGTAAFPFAGSIRVLNLAECRLEGVAPLPPKGDVTDWLQLGGNKLLLERLVDGIPPWDGPPDDGDGDQPPPGRYPHTDLGNAERLVDRHGKDLRYLAAGGDWLIWDGGRWQGDADGEIVRRAIETVRAINDEIRAEKDNNHRNWLVRHQQASEGAKKIESMIKLASKLPGVPVRMADMDANHWLLNLKNGTLDLRTGQLREHQREDLITRRIDLEYDATATCPRWHQFLHEVMDGDAELVAYLQRAIGYTITGSVREHAFWIHHGTGRNGKSTFLDVIRALLGPYAAVADFETFLSNRNRSGPRDDLADLTGARLVTASEAAEGRRLDEAVIKQITGGDPIRARALHKAGFVYNPTYKIHVAANHLPHIRGDDEGIWSRIHRIPWRVHFKDKPDKDLPAKLRAELPGVLLWAVQGCLEWQQGGLQAPKVVVDAIDDYRKEMDIIALFLSECCVRALGAKVSASDLYLSYKSWAETVGERPLTSRQFNERIRARGIRETTPGHKLHFHDIGLLEERFEDRFAGSKTCDVTERGGKGGKGGSSSNLPHGVGATLADKTSLTSPHDMNSCDQGTEEGLFAPPPPDNEEGSSWYR